MEDEDDYGSIGRGNDISTSISCWHFFGECCSQAAVNHQQSFVTTSQIVAHVERMRQIHDKYLIVDQECKDKVGDVEAFRRRDRILAGLSRMSTSSTSMNDSLSPN